MRRVLFLSPDDGRSQNMNYVSQFFFLDVHNKTTFWDVQGFLSSFKVLFLIQFSFLCKLGFSSYYRGLIHK